MIRKCLKCILNTNKFTMWNCSYNLKWAIFTVESCMFNPSPKTCLFSGIYVGIYILWWIRRILLWAPLIISAPVKLLCNLCFCGNPDIILWENQCRTLVSSCYTSWEITNIQMCWLQGFTINYAGRPIRMK